MKKFAILAATYVLADLAIRNAIRIRLNEQKKLHEAELRNAFMVGYETGKGRGRIENMTGTFESMIPFED